jgi:hypothetical protein
MPEEEEEEEEEAEEEGGGGGQGGGGEGEEEEETLTTNKFLSFQITQSHIYYTRIHNYVVSFHLVCEMGGNPT